MRDYDGKTAAERTAERRQRLIDAGFELFGEHGYAGTSIRAVLRRAELRDRYFAESFPDLDSLLAAVYSQLIEEEITACRAAIDAESGSSDGGARAMIAALVRSLEGDPGRARIKLREAAAGGPVARKCRQDGLHKLAELVASLLPPSKTRSAKDRLLLSVGMVAAADEWLTTWIDGEQNLTPRDVVNLVMTMFDALAERGATDATHD